MKARTILLTLLCAVGMAAYANEKIYVNRDVTTHIVMPEPIKLVDISTPKIAGNQCTDNIVRIKPYHDEGDSIQSGGYTENELLGTITLIGERHIAQYDVLYTEEPGQAAAIFEVPYTHTQSYINPEVTMPMSERDRRPPSSRCRTPTRSPTSTPKSPCPCPRWPAMRGRCTAAGASTTRS